MRWGDINALLSPSPPSLVGFFSLQLPERSSQLDWEPRGNGHGDRRWQSGLDSHEPRLPN